jgi:hypothetical protein
LEARLERTWVVGPLGYFQLITNTFSERREIQARVAGAPRGRTTLKARISQPTSAEKGNAITQVGKGVGKKRKTNSMPQAASRVEKKMKVAPIAQAIHECSIVVWNLMRVN